MNRRKLPRLDAKQGEKIACCIAVGLFLLSMLPIFAIARYDIPCADDFVYGGATKHTWDATGSIFAVLKSAADEVGVFYQTWQGTYSAIFLMALEPAVFGEQYYAAVPYLMLLGLIASTLFLSWAVLRRVFGATRPQFILTALGALTICIQMVPSAVEAFFWYNGAVYYTFFYSLALAFLGLLILMVQAKRTKTRVILLVLGCGLALVLGGGNYTTVLVTLLLVLLGIAGLAISRDGRFKWLVLPFAALLAGFAVSAAAPGNAVRQSTCETTAVPETVLRSIVSAAQHIDQYSTLVMLIAVGFLVPVLWEIAKNSGMSFRRPLLVVFLSCGLFAAQYCPPIYAMDFDGPPRLLDIIFFSYVLFLLFDLFYVMGWIARRMEVREPKEPFLMGKLLRLAFMTAALAFCCVNIPRTTPFTTTSACSALKGGGPQQYWAEAQIRFSVLEDSTQKEAYLFYYSQRPYLLYCDDGIADPNDWRNTAIAGYYGKTRVYIVSRP